MRQRGSLGFWRESALMTASQFLQQPARPDVAVLAAKEERLASAVKAADENCSHPTSITSPRRTMQIAGLTLAPTILASAAE